MQGNERNFGEKKKSLITTDLFGKIKKSPTNSTKCMYYMYLTVGLPVVL